MEKFYFTFGIGQTLLANKYVVIKAETYGEARDIMVESFGTKWAFQYNELEWASKDLVKEYKLQKLNVNEF